jgi:ubiquinone/menaquinone biosynthesis C-methylase UbiE
MNKRSSQEYKATAYFVREGTVSKWWHPKLHEYSIQLLNLLSPHEGELVLDAGIGTGIHANEIVRNGSRVVGLDISREMLSKCSQIDDQVDLVMVDIQHMPFKAEAFDKVFCVSSISLKFFPPLFSMLGICFMLNL